MAALVKTVERGADSREEPGERGGIVFRNCLQRLSSAKQGRRDRPHQGLHIVAIEVRKKGLEKKHGGREALVEVGTFRKTVHLGSCGRDGGSNEARGLAGPVL